jgi:hypothetical protein
MQASAAFRFLGLPALIAIGVLPFANAPATAQIGAAPLGAQNGALGGAVALHGLTHPLGGFSTGTGMPPGSVLGRPGYGYGGNRGPNNGNNNNKSRRGVGGYPYAYSLWVPDYFDYLDQTTPYGAPYGYAPPLAPDPGAAYGASPSQPVIINQYFSGPAPGAAPQQYPPPEANNTSAQGPGDPLSAPEKYYLIAYKDHAIYAALAYWVEDKTLHYVTTQNTHNQASLDLIDLPLTKSLNQDRNIPFTLSAQ